MTLYGIKRSPYLYSVCVPNRNIFSTSEGNYSKTINAQNRILRSRRTQNKMVRHEKSKVNTDCASCKKSDLCESRFAKSYTYRHLMEFCSLRDN